MKPLIVTDKSPYSTRDAADGYFAAFDELKIKYDAIKTWELFEEGFATPREEIVWRTIHSIFLENDEYTHLIIIGNVQTPEFIFNKKFGKKVVYIALDDPHTTKHLITNKNIDYYFTNEIESYKKARANKLNHVYYCPVAANEYDIPDIKNLEDADIVFVGFVYPNRVEVLENIYNVCNKLKLKFKIFGGGYTDNSKILRKITLKAVIPNIVTRAYYKNAMAVINCDREITWNAATNSFYNPLLYTQKANSMNPRSYEIAICHTPQLYWGNRKEYKNVFGNNIFYINKDNLETTLAKIKRKDYDTEMIERCFCNVKNNHSYKNRLEYIYKILTKGIK